MAAQVGRISAALFGLTPASVVLICLGRCAPDALRFIQLADFFSAFLAAHQIDNVSGNAGGLIMVQIVSAVGDCDFLKGAEARAACGVLLGLGQAMPHDRGVVAKQRTGRGAHGSPASLCVSQRKKRRRWPAVLWIGAENKASFRRLDDRVRGDEACPFRRKTRIVAAQAGRELLGRSVASEVRFLIAQGIKPGGASFGRALWLLAPQYKTLQ